ncbi:hypothetical protein T484DRAFT_1790382 [Baffinella frigidus]|nr:hypothetical protein T484DRAFT_1790382 [Cryptophyta sp. CCMP2293]
MSGPACAFCAKKTASCKQCSTCKRVVYCGAACQKQHWKTHKPDCQAPRAEPPQDRQFMRSQFANQNATLSPSQRWDLVNQANQRKDYAEVLRSI